MRNKVAIFVAVLLILNIFTGCSKAGNASNEDQITEAVDNNVSQEVKVESPQEPAFSYPLKSVELSYWMDLSTVVSQYAANMAETPFNKLLEEKTGVKVDYIHPVQGQAKEQFNLMVVSGQYPDIVEFNIIKDYVGGPEKAISDGLIIDLTDLIPKYAPNLNQFYLDHPDIAKLAKTDTGKYYSFPFIRSDDSLNVFFGPIVNTVWLKDLGLDYPETIEDWHNMLTLFKNEKGAKAPLTYEAWMVNSANGSPFIGAFGVSEDFYLDEAGKVQYGPIQPGYKKFLETFTQWYAEGLIDPDIETVDKAQVAAKLANGEAGASIGYGSSRLGIWLKAIENDPTKDFLGVKFPVEVRGDIPMFTQKSFPLQGSDAFITTSCEDVESAMRFLDYGYSKEGMLDYNFGVEGKTYEMIGDYPTYTDFVLKNPERSPAEVLSQYVRATSNAPMIQMKEYGDQYNFTFEQQVKSIENWSVSRVDEFQLPNITPTPEESEELAMIMSEVNTYRDEMQVKYIFGIEDLSNYDNYVKNIKDMGIDRAIEIYTEALERFNNR